MNPVYKIFFIFQGSPVDKIILHLDMNSFFASVEQQANPFLRGKPIGVTGKRQERSVVAAASSEAKRFGVKTAMSTWEAKQTCPSLILVAGDPEKYDEISRRFNAILVEYTNRVEPFSVDESFADITDAAKDYFGAIFVAQTMRERVRQACGEWITCSMGIAPNKLIAKLACERVKPNGLTVVRPHEVISLLDHSSLEDLCGIGPRMADRLAQLGITSFSRLRECSSKFLQKHFKSYGDWLYETARGRGDDSIPPLPEGGQGGVGAKSYGHSYTLKHDTSDPKTVERYLLRLCDKVAWRLRRDGYSARCITLKIRFKDFSGFGKQQALSEPANDGLIIFKIARSLLSPLSKGGLRGVLNEPIRLVGIRASELTRTDTSASLFRNDQKIRATLRALDALQHRFGEVWTRASLLHITLLARSSGFHFDHETPLQPHGHGDPPDPRTLQA